MAETNLTNIPLPFSDIHIPIIFFIVFILVGLLILGLIFGYLIYDWNMGRALRIFFTTRIEKWKDRNVSIFEILTLSNNVKFERCQGNRDVGFTRIPKTQVIVEPLNMKKIRLGVLISILLFISTASIIMYLGINILFAVIGLLFFIIPLIEVAKKRPQETILIDGREPSYIIPTSVYSMNTVDLVPLLDLHPQVPDRIEKGISILISEQILTLKAFIEKAKEEPNKILYDNVTYDVFLSTYLSFKNKFSVRVTVKDILNFISANVDENYRESLEIKDYNVATHKKNNDKYIKYLYFGILIMCLAFFIRVVYRTIYGGGTP